MIFSTRADAGADSAINTASANAKRAIRRIFPPNIASEPNHFAPDQHAPDLVRPRADVEQLGIAVVAFDRPVLGVAGPAQRLHRFVGDLHRIFGRKQYRAGGVEARGATGIAGFGDLVDVGP